MSLNRVLVAEDMLLMAMDLTCQLQDMGAQEVCCAHRLGSGIRMIEDNPRFDLAVLDVNLGDELVFPLADMLWEAGIPIVFVTAQQAGDFPDEWRDRAPIVQKPMSDQQLLAAVRSVQASSTIH